LIVWVEAFGFERFWLAKIKDSKFPIVTCRENSGFDSELFEPIFP
jgi:hypothetical protein